MYQVLAIQVTMKVSVFVHEPIRKQTLNYSESPLKLAN